MLENFHEQYVVIMVQAVDNSGEDTDHLHSIVVKLGGSGADFSIEGLLEKLHGTSLEVLQPDLEAKYVPWTYTSPRVPIERLAPFTELSVDMLLERSQQLHHDQ